MVGLTILAVVAIYIGIVWWLVRFVVKKNWARGGVILAALAIPFWDWPIGYLAFQQHCTTEGGLRTLSKLPPTSAVFLDAGAPYTPEVAFRHGMTTVEYKKNAVVTRHTPTSKPAQHASLQSTIKVSGARNQRLPWNIIRNDTFVSRISDGQVVARHSDFTWLGTWWQAGGAPYFGYGLDCFRDSTALISVVAKGVQ
jgi:hypothetical protein